MTSLFPDTLDQLTRLSLSAFPINYFHFLLELANCLEIHRLQNELTLFQMAALNQILSLTFIYFFLLDQHVGSFIQMDFLLVFQFLKQAVIYSAL